VTSAGETLSISFPTPVVGSGLVLSGRGSALATDATTVTTVGGARYVMDGELQSALRDASFRFTGYRQGVAVFRTLVTRQPVWIASARATTAGVPADPAVGAAHRVSTTPWGDETDSVTTHQPATLVRSEAFALGWTATARDTTTGRTRPLPVVRIGLIEGVRLPAGSYTVMWTYRPSSVRFGMLGTLAGGVVVAVAGVSWLGSRRQRWRRRRA
jgi:hypothetical protein